MRLSIDAGGVRPLLSIRDFSVDFGLPTAPFRAVDGLDLDVARGETVVLVGESGSGKTITALGIVRLLPLAARIVRGSIRLDESELLALPEYRMNEVRGARIGVIFQEPQAALNPVMAVGAQIGEVLRQHQRLRGRVLRDRIVELLDSVGIADPGRRALEYPHQYSGGMKQRAMIAIAIAGEPDLLIADEPTTALDVTVQAQVLALLKEQQQRCRMGLLFITHDLAVASQIADRIAVMKAGRIVETGTRAAFFRAPQHEYSRQLFSALPSVEKRRLEQRTALETGQAPVLEIRNLKVHFPIRRGLFKRITGYVKAVDGVSLTIAKGETLAIVGESGSGKTSMGRGILRLLEIAGGEVRFKGTDLATLTPRELRGKRAELQVVFQDPYASMNPRMLVGDIIQEGMLAQGMGGTRAERARRVDALLRQVGLEPAHRQRYPHEFSGGQRQRICIARALAVEPDLVVCDEPTSALDVTVQAQILALLRELQDRLGLAYLFITHNLAVVAYLAHRVAVMHRGVIVEQGPVEQVLRAPAHPYTQQLLAAVPRIEST